MHATLGQILFFKSPIQYTIRPSLCCQVLVLFRNKNSDRLRSKYISIFLQCTSSVTKVWRFTGPIKIQSTVPVIIFSHDILLNQIKGSLKL